MVESMDEGKCQSRSRDHGVPVLPGGRGDGLVT